MRKRKPRLTVLTIGVLNAYVLFYKNYGRTPSVRELARELDLSHTPVYRHLAKLQALGIFIPIKHPKIKYVINTELFYPLRRITFINRQYDEQRASSHAKYFLEDIEIPIELTYSHAKDYNVIQESTQSFYENVAYKRTNNPNVDPTDLQITEQQ